MTRSTILLALGALLCAPAAFADAISQTRGTFVDKFRQLDETWPDANVWRSATGAPGPQYWQQRADYDIDVTLLEDARRIEASETIAYTNNSPETLRWLWLQLDQNRFRKDSADELTRTMGRDQKIRFTTLRREQTLRDFEGGHRIGAVKDARGRDLPHTVVGTMLRIDLPTPLAPGADITFSIDWAYDIPDARAFSPRAGYEHFAEDGNDIFLIAQWFPRMVAFSDYEGWHNKDFLGRGEFTLEFGDYEVAITVPEDHVVSSTGVLQNPAGVLTKVQRDRLKQAETADKPVFVVTPEEALENEQTRATGTKTWRFAADNVRDFAWASSRKFIWDAQGYRQDGDALAPDRVMAMSFYPKEGEPLWSRYSTEAVIHTLEVYSRYSFPYAYPTAQSVNGPVGGMEYPMITFNGPRTDPHEDGDRTYSRSEKEFLIGVVIHEIGHIYFPMTVNSDERQWTWMDEGINTFLQHIAEMEWGDGMRSDRGDPRFITDYMASDRQVPIMTNSESILQFGNNAYAKPATALVVLRETILGRELFDFAFREYARRWRFKRPTPYDLFRTLEEASGVDLDWFWRGWFYSTDHVDISLDKVWKLRVDTKDPDVEKPWERQQQENEPDYLFIERNEAAGLTMRTDRDPTLNDLYSERDEFTVTDKDRNEYDKFLDKLVDKNHADPQWMRRVYDRAVAEDRNYYVLELSNVGGLVMPVILGITYADGSEEELRIPAEIWRRSPDKVRKLLVREGDITEIVVDPHWETADVDVENNHYPRRFVPSRLEMYKREDKRRNLMEDLRVEREVHAPEGADDAGDVAVPMKVAE
ncbi:MAG TPA: M1 family metallopeptidase [Pseudomonadales bacterium]|nr:M1 family metallopeptidase [Pseudomonadales bacterium]